MIDSNDTGWLRIANKEDRATVANILFNNGYTVGTVRRKLNGKAFEYFVKFETKPIDAEEDK